MPDQPGPECFRFETGRVDNFLPTSNFDLWYFCSLFTYKDVQYLIWKIWLISVWRLKAKAMAWLVTWFMFAQSTLISYHREAFFKTKVDCTVSCAWGKIFILSNISPIVIIIFHKHPEIWSKNSEMKLLKRHIKHLLKQYHMFFI